MHLCDIVLEVVDGNWRFESQVDGRPPSDMGGGVSTLYGGKWGNPFTQIY